MFSLYDASRSVTYSAGFSAADYIGRMSLTNPSPAFAADTSTRFAGSSIDADGFKALFRGHPGAVSVITAEGPDGPVALTATSVASVSVDPPLLIFSVSELTSAAPSILAAESVVVHLLDGDDLEVAKLASTSGADRFADRDRWTRLATGEPLYHGVRASDPCRDHQSLRGRRVHSGRRPGPAGHHHPRTRSRIRGAGLPQPHLAPPHRSIRHFLVRSRWRQPAAD